MAVIKNFLITEAKQACKACKACKAGKAGKARNKLNHANIIEKQRVAPLKHAYDREDAELKAMIKEYNTTHPGKPYGKR